MPGAGAFFETRRFAIRIPVVPISTEPPEPMKLARGAAGALALLALLAPPARAQGITQGLEDARVLPRGWIEVRGFGTYTQYDERFDGGREPLSAGFVPSFQSVAERLAQPAVNTLGTQVAAFFAGTAGQVTDPQAPTDLGVGEVALETAADVRYVPITLEYGLTSRISLGVTVPFERVGTAVNELLLRGGTIGVNPSSARNAPVLGRIGAAYAALGQGGFLPTATSAAGRELQRRVRAISGGADSLELPTVPASLAVLLESSALAAQLTEDEAEALRSFSDREGFQLGDVEVGARVQLVNTAPGFPFPLGTRQRGVRTTLGLRARLGTGVSRDTSFFLQIPSESGHFGFGVDLVNDVFLSGRWWITAAGSYDQRFAADVQRRAYAAGRLFPPDTAFRTVRREPGARFSLRLTPRYRLTRDIGFLGQYGFESVGATTLSVSDDRGGLVVNPFEVTTAATAHRAGLGMSYTTIEAYREGRAGAPVEFWLVYRNTVAGGGGAPRSGSVELGGRIPYQLFGRPRRERPDTAAADSAAAPLAPPERPTVDPVRPPTQPRVPAPTPENAPPPATPEQRPPAQPAPQNPPPTTPPPSPPTPPAQPQQRPPGTP